MSIINKGNAYPKIYNQDGSGRDSYIYANNGGQTVTSGARNQEKPGTMFKKKDFVLNSHIKYSPPK